MRIVIDMQGAQNGSRHRGIGRYTLALARALLRNRGSHELIFALSKFFPETIEEIRTELHAEDAGVRIELWGGVGPVKYLNKKNDWRRSASELIREAFLYSLSPDVVIVSSIIEGATDDSVTSIGRLGHVFTAAVFYDLIPLLYPSEYLAEGRVADWYEEKTDHLRRADLLFGISESSRQEAIKYLGCREDRVTNISAAVGPEFRKIECSSDYLKALSINQPFILYTGATDPRKNLNRLICAYAELPLKIRGEYQLVIAGGLPASHRVMLEKAIRRAGLKKLEVVITGRVSDEELIILYNLCSLYVFPSLHEGFGLPVLEAMACGAPVIGSAASSVPEVVGMPEALFDPSSIEDISKTIRLALCDDEFRAKLIAHAGHQKARFSWDATAKRLIDTLEYLHASNEIQGSSFDNDVEGLIDRLLNGIAAIGEAPGDIDLVRCAAAVEGSMLNSQRCINMNLCW